MKLFNRTKKAEEVDLSNLPRHIGVIMDGNGRWATKRGLPRTAGHAAGAEVFRSIATYCRDIGIQYLTVYAFSTENWKRPAEEVSAIMGLLDKYLHEAIEKMEQDHIRTCFFGDTSVLSPALQKLIRETEEISARYTGFQVNICVNYGSRDEILRAARACAASGEPITEEALSGAMYSAGIPDPDLIIRPSGEYRLSNFLLWQAAYAELYFTDTLWPDFTSEDLNMAIADYQHRSRRYGGIKST